jgi:hypothetical protein
MLALTLGLCRNRALLNSYFSSLLLLGHWPHFLQVQRGFLSIGNVVLGIYFGRGENKNNALVKVPKRK